MTLFESKPVSRLPSLFNRARPSRWAPSTSVNQPPITTFPSACTTTLESLVHAAIGVEPGDQRAWLGIDRAEAADDDHLAVGLQGQSRNLAVRSQARLKSLVEGAVRARNERPHDSKRP